MHGLGWFSSQCRPITAVTVSSVLYTVLASVRYSSSYRRHSRLFPLWPPTHRHCFRRRIHRNVTIVPSTFWTEYMFYYCFLLASFYSYTSILILCRCVLSLCVINEYVCIFSYCGQLLEHLVLPYCFIFTFIVAFVHALWTNAWMNEWMNEWMNDKRLISVNSEESCFRRVRRWNVGFYRAMHFSAKRGVGITCRHVLTIQRWCWNSSKLLSAALDTVRCAVSK